MLWNIYCWLCFKTCRISKSDPNDLIAHCPFCGQTSIVVTELYVGPVHNWRSDEIAKRS